MLHPSPPLVLKFLGEASKVGQQALVHVLHRHPQIVLVASVPPFDQELLHSFVTNFAALALEDGFCLELRSWLATAEVWCRQGWRRLSWRVCVSGR